MQEGRTQDPEIDALVGGSGLEEQDEELGVRREEEAVSEEVSPGQEIERDGKKKTHGKSREVMFCFPSARIRGSRFCELIWPRKKSLYVAFATTLIRLIEAEKGLLRSNFASARLVVAMSMGNERAARRESSARL